MAELTFPLQYFGPLSYYSELIKSTDLLFEVWETFPRHSYRNKCEILGANGVIKLSVPVRKPEGSRTKTGEIEIDDREKWVDNHLKTLKSAYSKTPYFDYYFPSISELLEAHDTMLVNLNRSLMRWCLKQLQKEPTIHFTDTFIKESAGGLRNYDQRIEEMPHYYQTFEERFGFIPDLSILDGLMNLGPELRLYLKDL